MQCRFRRSKKKRYKTIKQINEKGLNQFADDFVKAIFHEDSFKTKKDRVEHIKQVILTTSPKTIVSTLEAMANRNETCSILSSITVPTLIICGADDKVTPPEKSEAMHKAIKNSTYAIIDKASHLSNIDQPDEFNRHLQNFLNGLKE